MKFSDLHESEQRGTLTFPVSYYYITSDDPRYIMKPHWHKDFEIIKVITGEFRVFLNNIPYNLHRGDILFVPCGALHRGEPKNSIYECIVLDLNFLRHSRNDSISSFLSPLINGNLSINCLLNKTDNLIYATANSLFNSMRSKNDFFELDVCSLLLKLFCELYRNNYIFSSKKIQKSGKQAQNIIKMLDWIEENLFDVITLKKLSEVSGLNEKYICKIFKDYTSKTPVSYINEMRIEAACHEMTANGSSVTKAAFDCGFNDLSYFSKVFKSYKGISPKEYRNRKFV